MCRDCAHSAGGIREFHTAPLHRIFGGFGTLQRHPQLWAFPLVTTKLVNFQILIFIEDTARMNFRVPFAQAHGCHF